MEIVKLLSILWKAPKYKSRPPQKKQAPGYIWRGIWFTSKDIYFFKRKLWFTFSVSYLKAVRKPVEHRQPSRRLA